MEHPGHIQASAPGRGGEWTPAVCVLEADTVSFTVNGVDVTHFDRATTFIEPVEQSYRISGGDETLWFAPNDRERFRLGLSGPGSMADRIAMAKQMPSLPPTPAVTVPKSPGTAAVLSALWPGLGHIYIGKIGVGIFSMLFHVINVALVFVIIGLLTLPLFWGLAIWDAHKGAQAWNEAHGISS